MSPLVGTRQQSPHMVRGRSESTQDSASAFRRFPVSAVSVCLWVGVVSVSSPSANAQICTPELRGLCDDQNACTVDKCECPPDQQLCHCAHAPLVCIDAFAPCRTISCNPTPGPDEGCQFEFIVCDDGDWCTDPDVCVQNVGCIFPPRICNDGNACTDDSCDSQNRVCVHDDTGCDDGDVCNGIETCDPDLGCQAGSPVDCDDLNACTTDSCDSQTGCVHVDISDTCIDGNPCTTDRCEPGNGCVFDEILCDDQDECTKDLTCEPATGVCPTACYDINNDPPTGGIPGADDRTFVATTATVTPLTIRAEIFTTRYAGPTIAGTGTLANVAARVGAGVLGSHAELTIEAYHIHCAGAGDCAVANTVFFNGTRVDVLDPMANPSATLIGPCGDSQPTSFQIPIDQVNFPEAVGFGGAAPTPGSNVVEIQFAETNGCRSLAYASLAIQIMSPVILVHGNGSDAGFFDRHGLTAEWDSLQPGSIPLLWNRAAHQEIDMPTGTRAQHAAWLSDDDNDPVPKVANLVDIAAEFGVDSVHVVAFGKGGLDVRAYLQDRYRSQRNDPNRPFDVLSLTTIGTPHNGSPAADQISNSAAVVQGVAALFYAGFPSFDAPVTALLGTDLGTPDQTSATNTAFNASNLRLLPKGVVYSTISGEADSNGNGLLDANPDEWSAMAAEESSLRQAAADMAYRVLRSTPQITVALDLVPGTFDVFRAHIVTPPIPAESANDAVVTVQSAHGDGGFAQPVIDSAGWTRTVIGANHASLATQPSARQVAAWLKRVDQVSGDLR